MINFDDVTKAEKKKNNPNWLQVPDHPQALDLEK